MENNWTINQTKELFDLVKSASDEGKALGHAFRKAAESTGRSVNSVRNYYYSQLKMFELVPGLADDLGVKVVRRTRAQFEFFKSEEVDSLLRIILTDKAKGKSVRSSIASIADSPKEQLRILNKYRSMIAHHKPEVVAIMNDLSAKGLDYFNPYTKQICNDVQKSGIDRLNEFIGKLDESEVNDFLKLLGKLI